MTNYDLMLEIIRDEGMDYKWAKMFIKKFADDEKEFPVSDEERRWAMERGFFPGRIALYGLTESNYMEYVPDFNYFMLHPMNNHFLKWLDKTTLKYVLNSNGCESTMPEYYIYIENDGSYTYLMDCPSDIKKDEDFLTNLLKQKGILAMKPNSGTSGGFGFIKLELSDGVLLENNKLIDIKRLEQIKASMRNYIVTEYAHQHPDLDEIWPDSECTLRVIMCKNPKGDPYAPATWSCVVSYARFGTAMSGGASNLSSGGVGVGFNFSTGQYNDEGIRYRRFSEDANWLINRHPDTGVVWAGLSLPNWQYVKGKINDICQHISSLDYLGLDIIITEDGMKLCEINSHPALDYEQVLNGPALMKDKVRDFFDYKGLRSFDGKAFYEAYVKSQDQDCKHIRRDN